MDSVISDLILAVLIGLCSWQLDVESHDKVIKQNYSISDKVLCMAKKNK